MTPCTGKTRIGRSLGWLVVLTELLQTPSEVTPPFSGRIADVFEGRAGVDLVGIALACG